MNILLINHYAGSPLYGMEFRPWQMSREWMKMGHRVCIVAASNSHVRAKQPAVSGAMTEDWVEEVPFRWIKTPAYCGNGLGRALNIFSFVGQLLRLARRLARDLRPDVVIASSTYPLDALPALRIARLAGARLIFEVHDLWPLSPVELGGMSPSHPFIRVMQWAENYAYAHADSVVSMLPLAEEHMRAHGLAPGKFHYVPNGVVVDAWLKSSADLPHRHQSLIAHLRQTPRFLLCYAGAHGVANGLDTLLDAAALLRDDPVDIVLVGHGPEKDRLRRTAERACLDNVHFLPSVPKHAMPNLLAAMDALFISLRPSSIFRFGISPNKLMDYMMAGKPVVQAIDAGNDLVEDSGCGISIAPGDAAAISGAIRRLISLTREAREAMGSRGRDYVGLHHDYRALAQRFADVFTGPAEQAAA